MPAINKDLLHQGFNFATACYDAGLDATPVTSWLSQQGKLMAEPIAGNTGAGTALGRNTGLPLNGMTSFDNAVLTAVQSSPQGVGITDLAPILAQYNRPNNQIGAALTRLQKKLLIAKQGDLWTAGKIDKSIDKRRATRRNRTPTARKATTAANSGAGNQPQATMTATG